MTAPRKLKSKIRAPCKPAHYQPRSFKDALLGFPSPHPTPKKTQQDGEPRLMPDGSDQGWQTVRSRRSRRALFKQQKDFPQPLKDRRARYLAMVDGLCFNCLSPKHKIAVCKKLTKCWRCRRARHISSACPRRITLPPSTTNHRSPVPHHHPSPTPQSSLSSLLLRHWLPSTSSIGLILMSTTSPSPPRSGIEWNSLNLTPSSSGSGGMGSTPTSFM
jgi:hypothetical protein